MRYLGPIAILCAVLGLSACGGDEAPANPEEAEVGKVKPTIEPPPGGPPTKLVVRDRVEGLGPAAKAGDMLSIRYIGVGEDGKARWSTWGDGPPLTFELGLAEFFEGWDEAVEGMKAGGRREITFPAIMSGEPLFYVVDLLKIK